VAQLEFPSGVSRFSKSSRDYPQRFGVASVHSGLKIPLLHSSPQSSRAADTCDTIAFPHLVTISKALGDMVMALQVATQWSQMVSFCI
jgi:hypothetical protein